MRWRLMLVGGAAVAMLAGAAAPGSAHRAPMCPMTPGWASTMDRAHAAIFHAAAGVARTTGMEREMCVHAWRHANAVHRRLHDIGLAPGKPVDVSELSRADLTRMAPMHGHQMDLGAADRAMRRMHHGDKDLSAVSSADRVDRRMRRGDKDLSEITSADRIG